MSKNTSIALIAWNILLTLGIIWLLAGGSGGMKDKSAGDADSSGAEPAVIVDLKPDSGALAHSRVAYFWLDKVNDGYTGVSERKDRLNREIERHDRELKGELQRSQDKLEELRAKDRTYTTVAENKADEAEVQHLSERMGQLQQQAEDELTGLQERMLEELQVELTDFLTHYNSNGDFDFIYMIRDPGQIWPGNPDLDITPVVIDGLNAQHKAKKKP